MADAKLQLLIDLQDNVSAGLKGVASSVDSFGSKVKDLKPVFDDMAKVGVVGFAAVGAEIYASINSANESAKVQSQLAAVLKSTGNAAGLYAEDINDESAALQRMTTYNDEAIGSAANLLLTFTNIKGAVFQEALPAILDMSTALGQDLKSSAVQVGKALNDPINGITALQRVGVSFTDDQKALVAQMVATGKTADAQRYILAELNKEFGGSAAAAADTYAGKMQQLANTIDDVQEAIGGALIPIITDMAKKLQPLLTAVLAWITAHPKLTAVILLTTAGLFALVAIIGTVGIAMIGLTGVATALGISLLALFGWILLIPIAIAAVIAIGVLLYTHWGQISAYAQQLWSDVVAAWNGMVAGIQAAFSSVVAFLSAVWDTIKAIFFTAVDLLIGSWATLLDFFFPGWLEALTSVYQSTLQFFGLIGAFITATLATIGGGIQSALDTITGVWNTAWNAVADAFSSVWEGIKGVAQSAFDYIAGGVDKVLGPLQKVIDIANKAYDAAKRAIDLVGSGVKSVISTGAKITGHATGGPVLGGSPTIVGEHGPELFIPSSTGSIMPNRQLAGMGPGGGMNIYLTISGNTLLDRDAVRKIGGEFVKYLKDNVRV